MATKVIGTGAPRMLTVRLKSCEAGMLRDELFERRAVITEAVASAQARCAAAGTGASENEIEDRHDELFLIAQLLDQLRAPGQPDRRRDLVGPTWLLGPVIRGASMEAAERLRDAVAAFAADTGSLSPDQLQAAVDAAAAITATLIGLDHVENHAVDT